MFLDNTTAKTAEEIETRVERMARRRNAIRMFWVALLVFGFAFVASLARGQDMPTTADLKAAKAAQQAGEQVLISAAQRAAEIEAQVLVLQAEARLLEAKAKLRAAQAAQRTVESDSTTEKTVIEKDGVRSEKTSTSYSGTSQAAHHEERMADIDRKKAVGLAKAQNPTCGFWNCPNGVMIGSTGSYYSQSYVGNTAYYDGGVYVDPNVTYVPPQPPSLRRTTCGEGGCNTTFNTGR